MDRANHSNCAGYVSMAFLRGNCDLTRYAKGQEKEKNRE